VPGITSLNTLRAQFPSDIVFRTSETVSCCPERGRDWSEREGESQNGEVEAKKAGMLTNQQMTFEWYVPKEALLARCQWRSAETRHPVLTKQPSRRTDRSSKLL
jgi:hypothetical protein